MQIFIFVFYSMILQNVPVAAQLNTSITWTEESSLPADEVLYYSADKILTWDDFQGSAEDSRSAAVTVSGFGYTANINTRNGNGNLNIKVYCYFNKAKSWVKSGRTTSYILTHEQHHFDISYIAARVFVDKLRNAKFTPGNYNMLLTKIYNESCQLMNQLQDDYDGQTKNGQLKDVQYQWNDMLDEKINLLTK